MPAPAPTVPIRPPAASPPAYRYTDDERPRFPGAPFTPKHGAKRRAAYLVAGIFLGAASTFPNGLVTANTAALPGSFGVYIAQISWLPAVYVAMNASSNLTLVKARSQFGIPAVTLALSASYALAVLFQLLLPTFGGAVIGRAINGMMAGALVSLSIYYLLQAFTPKTRALALVIALGLTQVGIPLARMAPVDFLVADNARGLHLVELATALTVIAVTLALPLPPSELKKAFSRTDLVTIALLVPCFLLACGVLGLGRVYWWTDTPSLGWMLAAAIPLFAAAMLIELHRRDPLIKFGWFTSLDILRFAAVALFVRLALVEQTYGSVGLLSAGGLDNDQLRGLFGCVAMAMVAGIGVAILTISERRLPFQVAAAALVIAAGAFLDSHSTNLTRPSQLYLSQCLLGFGATLFIGPAMAYGFLRLSERGPAFFVTFAVLFSLSQNVGSLAGSALLGSYQIIESHDHAASLADHIVATDPNVVTRLQGAAAALARTITDPTLRGVEGGVSLGRASQGEAAVLAFDDVFRLLTAVGVLTAAYVLYLLALGAFLKWARPAPGAAT